MPFPGVTVQEKGTNNGTVTDFDGRFSLPVASAKSILIFSYVGMEEQERKAVMGTAMNIKMRASTEALDEVVLIRLRHAAAQGRDHGRDQSGCQRF